MPMRVGVSSSVGAPDEHRRASPSRSPDETGVTLGVARWLHERGFEIISVALPRSGSGLVLHRHPRRKKDDPPDADRGDLVPDVVVQSCAHLIVVESKQRFCFDDITKLGHLTTDRRYAEALGSLGVPPRALVTVHAFASLSEADLVDIEVSKKLVGALLRVGPDEDVSVVSDSTGAFAERER